MDLNELTRLRESLRPVQRVLNDFDQAVASMENVNSQLGPLRGEVERLHTEINGLRQQRAEVFSAFERDQQVAKDTLADFQAQAERTRRNLETEIREHEQARDEAIADHHERVQSARESADQAIADLTAQHQEAHDRLAAVQASLEEHRKKLTALLT